MDDATCIERLTKELCRNISNEPFSEVSQLNKSPEQGDGSGFMRFRAILNEDESSKLLRLVEKGDFQTELDTTDAKPSYQIELINKYSGVPFPSLSSLEITSELFRLLLPKLLNMIKSLYAWNPRHIACNDVFVRRYHPGERNIRLFN